MRVPHTFWKRLPWVAVVLVIVLAVAGFIVSRPIRVDLGLESDGTIELVVADDGVGFPPGFDPRCDGKMGLNFIFMIGESQLNATVQTRLDQGVSYELKFKDNIYKARV